MKNDQESLGFFDKYGFIIQFDHAKTVFSSQTRDLSLGFPELEVFFDNYGFPPGTLTFIFAKSKVGKTYLVCNSIYFLVLSGRRVLFISLEMSSMSIIFRLCRLVMGLGVQDLKNYCLKKTGLDEVFQKFVDIRFPENLVIFDPPTAFLNNIEAAIEKFNPDVVFLDHLHRVSIKGTNDLFTQTTAIAYGLSDLAKKTGKIFVSLVQVSRGSEGNKADDGSVMPSLSAGKGSGALEEVADVIVGMCRPEIDPKLALKRQHQVELRIIGNRYGRSSPNLVYFYDPDSGMLIHEDAVERQHLLHERK